MKLAILLAVLLSACATTGEHMIAFVMFKKGLVYERVGFFGSLDECKAKAKELNEQDPDMKSPLRDVYGAEWVCLEVNRVDYAKPAVAIDGKEL